MSNLIETVRRLLIPKSKELINGAAVTMQVGANGVLQPLPVAPISSVAYDGLIIPPSSLLFHFEGQHTGADNQSILLDSNRGISTPTFGTTGALSGLVVRNTSKATGSVVETAIITNSSNATITGVLSNGALWDTWDYYEVVSNINVDDIIHYDNVSNLGGSVTVNEKGVPVIVGVSGDHSFNYFFEDISVPDTSPTYTLTVTVT